MVLELSRGLNIYAVAIPRQRTANFSLTFLNLPHGKISFPIEFLRSGFRDGYGHSNGY